MLLNVSQSTAYVQLNGMRKCGDPKLLENNGHYIILIRK